MIGSSATTICDWRSDLIRSQAIYLPPVNDRDQASDTPSAVCRGHDQPLTLVD
jgi:hypothetical protein